MTPRAVKLDSIKKIIHKQVLQADKFITKLFFKLSFK